MKRFTETDKWRDPWFRSLKARQKLLWVFLCDNCDHAGVIELDFSFLSSDLGLKVTPEDAEALGSRVSRHGGKWVITKFIPFQYGRLSEDCKPHKPVFAALTKHGLSAKGIESLSKATLESLSNPTLVGSGRVLDKEKEKDQDKEKDKEGGLQRGSTIPGSTVLPVALAAESRFVVAWEMWLEHLRQKRKPATLHAQDLQLRKCAEWGTERAIRAIEDSIRHNWQSIYEETHGSANNDRNRHIAGGDNRGKARSVINRREAEKKAGAEASGAGVGAKVA